MQERPIPEAAQLDDNSVEMLRVWIAKNKLHCSLKIGMYKESTNVKEEKAWGIILADSIKHIANALNEAYQLDVSQSIAAIRENLENELDKPSSVAAGNFVQKH